MQQNHNPYADLRYKAFCFTPEQLGLSLPADQTVVYGIIMDWQMGEGIVTVVSYQTGDSSVYISSGGGMIGGGQHPSVSSAAKGFVNAAQSYLDKTIKTETIPYPERNQVKFYLLTNKGIYVGEEEMVNFQNSTSAWYGLFDESNN
jgi:hypothetical protein